ncbi:MAG: YceI family protein [Betaproteobacteria bacterium]|nr:YceI family protein [Betaproteobacteria bacterium]MDE2622206.1 YceI family protein [Betaproteobacteria bacterium]
MTRLNRVFAAALVLVASTAWSAGFVPDKSSLTFVGKQMGAPVEGRFRHFDGDIVFNPADLAHSHARIEVDLASIDLASDESESEIKGKSWFHVTAHPKAVFESTTIRALGGDRYEVKGRLMVKGITRELTLPLQVHRVGGLMVAEGSTVLRRTDFNVGEGVWADPDSVALEVRVNYKMTLKS